MTGYYCESCRWLGSDPETRIEHDFEREPGKATVQLDYEVSSCPDCGSSGLVEVDLCERCLDEGIETEAYYDDGLCMEHHSEELQCMAEEAYDRSIGK